MAASTNVTCLTALVDKINSGVIEVGYELEHGVGKVWKLFPLTFPLTHIITYLYPHLHPNLHNHLPPFYIPFTSHLHVI